MCIDYYQTSPEESPTAQTLVQGEIDSHCSFWPELGEDDPIKSRVACNLLAVWAHLRRFDSSTLDNVIVSRINGLVAHQQHAICEQVLRSSFLENWTEIADRFGEAWDNITDNVEIDDLEHSISEHFELLDRCSLVVYAIKRVGFAVDSDERFQVIQNSVKRAEEYLADNPDVFLSAAVYASSMLDSYRDDLYDADEALWETTLKHRRLEELVDEQRYPQKPEPLPTSLLGLWPI